MEMIFRNRHLYAILTTLPILLAGLLSGCDPGCQTVITTASGARQLSSCEPGPSSNTSTTTTTGFSISGGVSGSALQGVLITLSGTATGNTTTDASGNYSFTGLAAGDYTVTPSLAGFVFNPVSDVVTVSGAAVIGNNFAETASAAATSIVSGTASGAVAQNVLINLSGLNTGSVLTDSSGNYSFSGLAAGRYAVTPSLAGFIFSPVSIVVTTTSGINAPGINFTATANASSASSISGTVSGVVVQNVTISLSGTNTGSALTDENGKFSFTGLAAGNYTVTPSLAGHAFSPASSTVTTTSGTDVTVSNFTSVL
jgi:Carboxypeptidase regulatory-like domain